MVETGYWGGIAGSAAESIPAAIGMCSNMLLQNVDVKCAIHFFINLHWTTQVVCYRDGKHAVSDCIIGNSKV